MDQTKIGKFISQQRKTGKQKRMIISDLVAGIVVTASML